jgi:fluoride ion exporter CrcB/FEX
VAAAATAAAAPDVVVLEEDDVGYPLGWAVADALAACTLIALTGVGIWWAAAWDEGSSSPFAQKSYGIALLFGPAGCLLRFYLSRFNGSLKGRWAWLPAGTFAANMVACAVNFSLRAGIDTTRHMPFAIEALLAGIMTGFSGSLSTVSTWVVEVRLVCFFLGCV